MNKTSNNFNVDEYINELFNKGEENIKFNYYEDATIDVCLCEANMILKWTISEKDEFIDKFNQYLKKIKELNNIDSDKAKSIFNTYFKDFNKNKYFDDLSVLGSRLNHLLVENYPNIIICTEIETSINLLLLNQYSKEATVEVNVDHS